MKLSWKALGMAGLAGVGLVSVLLASQWSPGWSSGLRGPGSLGDLSALHDPLRLMGLRSPGERGAGALLVKKPLRAAPPGGPPPPRLNMLRTPPPLPIAPEPMPTGPFAAAPIEPTGWLRGPPEGSFGGSPDGYWIYPPFGPPIGPWPEEPLVVVVGPNPPPLPPFPPTPPPAPIPEPSTWLMLILGVFGVGAMLRWRRAAARPA